MPYNDLNLAIRHGQVTMSDSKNCIKARIKSKKKGEMI
jgi:hypothetical protein